MDQCRRISFTFIEECGVDESGTDDTDLDVLVRQEFHPDAFCQAPDSILGGGVDGMAIHEEERGERGDDDDREPMALVIFHASLFQRRQDLVQCIDSAIDVGSDDPVDIDHIRVLQVSRVCNPCIAYQHIDRSPSERCRDGFGNGREIPHICSLKPEEWTKIFVKSLSGYGPVNTIDSLSICGQ